MVTDWRLGDADGRDIVVAARRLTDTPVVVISGYVNEAFQAPDPLADFYLEKPVNPEELIRVVNDLVKPATSRGGDRGKRVVGPIVLPGLLEARPLHCVGSPRGRAACTLWRKRRS